MIRHIVCAADRNSVLQRAQILAGMNEGKFAPEWLAQPDIFCVAQENEYNGHHHDSGSLLRAMGLIPDARWYSVETGGREKLSAPFEVTDPVLHLTTSDPSESLESRYTPGSFMLFSMNHEAAILYSSTYEYKLIAGEAGFVRAYMDGAESDPLRDLREWFEEELEDAQSKGNDDWVSGLRRTLDMALSQVKLPPPASGIGRPLTPESGVRGNDPGDR